MSAQDQEFLRVLLDAGLILEAQRFTTLVLSESHWGQR